MSVCASPTVAVATLKNKSSYQFAQCISGTHGQVRDDGTPFTQSMLQENRRSEKLRAEYEGTEKYFRSLSGEE